MTRRDWATIACLVLVIALVFADVVFFGCLFSFRDTTRFWYPTRKVLADIVSGGEFPSWNPYWNAGQPLAANPNYGVFYPPQWLTFLPPFDFWFRILIVAHVAVAACGAFVILRRWLRWESALFGAIVFALGGVTLSLINLLPFLFAVTWLPWIALAIERRRFGPAALLLAFVLIVGEPIVVGQLCVLIAAFSWMRRAPLRSTVLMFAIALLCSAAQLLPAFDLFRDSGRGHGLPFSLSAQWSTPPLRLLDLFIPRFTGTGATHYLFYWGTAKYGWVDPYFVGIYFGLLPLSLALAGLILRIHGARIVSLAVAISVLLALGSHTPIWRALFDVRIFSSVRYPEKFLILGLVPLMFFSAFAFDRARDDRRIARVAFAIAAMTTASCAALLALSLHPSYPATFIHLWGIEVHPLAAAMAQISRSVWLLALLRSAIAAAVLLLPRRRYWALLAVAVVTADLGVERFSIAETIDGDLLRTPPPAVAQLTHGVRLFHQADWYTGTVVARRYLDLPELNWVLRNGLYPMIGAIWGVPSAMNGDYDQTFSRPSDDFEIAMNELRRRNVPRWYEPLMSMSAAGYRAMFLPFHRAADPRRIDPIIFVPAATTNRIFYFADRIVPGRTRDDFISAVARGVTSHAVLADLQPRPLASGKVLAIRHSANSAEADVVADGDAFLIASITQQKYWRVTVDGREVPAIPVNLQYQAVFVGAGRHTVALRYRNPLLIAGGAMSILGLCLVVLISLRERHRIGKEVVEAPLELRA